MKRLRVTVQPSLIRGKDFACHLFVVELQANVPSQEICGAVNWPPTAEEFCQNCTG